MTEVADDRCRRYRRRILEISRQVSAAHIAPAFSCLEIVDALYHDVLRPQDIFIMSKGHGCLAQYVVLEDLGKMQPECGRCMGSGFDRPSTGYGIVCGECGGQRYVGPPLLDSYCKMDGKLGAHPDYAPQLGIHASTGSLGHGLAIAAGQALAERRRSDTQVYVLLSDGECQEGSTWEAAMVAANLRLENLTAIVDCNDFGGMERISAAHPALYPLADKFRAFGWACARDLITGDDSVDGHDGGAVHSAITWPVWGHTFGPALGPKAVVCRTVKGRGVSFMENAPIWHYRSPSEEEYVRALEELA